MTTEIDRRAALVAPLIAAALCQGEAMAQSTPPPASSYEPRPLPFAASAVPGLSERLLTSHWQNITAALCDD